MFLEDFLGGTVAEDLAVHGVDGPGHDITVILRLMGQGFTLAEVAANQTVGVLIASPLRGAEGMAIVFPLEGEEITEGGLEGLEIAVIKFDASFPQDEEGVFLRDEIAQLFIGEVADAGDKELREVSIDVPALFQV